MNKIPDDFSPFKELIICSNHFINGQFPIIFGENIPLLIGKGILPLIWLYIPITKKESIPLVERNTSLNKNIILELSKDESSVKIIESNIKELTILFIKKLDDELAEINEINLRPIGLDIIGDKNHLKVGTMHLTNNRFSNLKTMIKLD